MLMLVQALGDVPVARGADATPDPSAAVAVERSPTPDVSPTPASSPASDFSPTPASSPNPSPVPSASPAPTPTVSTTSIPAEPDPLDPEDELVEERTESSRTFDLGDGQLATEYFVEPRFYQPDGREGAFVEIEPGFAPVAGPDKAATSDKAPAAVTVAPAADARGFVAVEDHHDFRVALRPLVVEGTVDAVARASEPTIDNTQADLAEVFPGVDARVFAQPDAAKLYLILDEAPKTPAWTFLVDVPEGSTLAMDKETGAVDIFDALGERRAILLAPYAVDSTPDEHTGSGLMTSDVSYTIGEHEGTPTVRVSLDDAAWLEQAVYPVYVDPSIYLPGTNTYGDTFVNEGNPSMNYANYERPDSPTYYELWVGQSPSQSTYYTEAYLKYDVSLLEGMAIDAAEVRIFPYHAYYDAPTATTTWLRRIVSTGGWTESGLTWNNKPNAASTGVLTEGCVEGEYCSFDALSMIRNWADGSTTNNGLRLDTNGNGATYWKRVIASEENMTGSPRLVVTYRNPATIVYPSGGGKTASRTLAWAVDAPSAQTHYQVDVSANASFSPVLVSSGDVTSADGSWVIPSTTTLTPGATYHWRVRVKFGASNHWSPFVNTSFTHDPTANLGQQPQHTFESWDLGAGDDLSVNVGTGNLVISHPIVSLPIRGSSVDLDLTYNRHDTADVGMGPGWRLNMLRRLTDNGDGTVTFTDADGARHVFDDISTTGTVTTYTRPPTLYASLVKDTAVSANEFVLTYRNQSKDKFDISGSTGLLVREEDRFGNGIDLSYTSGQLTSISDTAGGRTISVGWTSGNLTSITDWANVSGGVVQATGSGNRLNRFFYSGGQLIGWADPLNTSASCPTGGSHLTCIVYGTNQLDVTKTQTVTTIGGSPAALGTATQTATTQVTFAGSDVANVKNAQEVFSGGDGTPFNHPNPGQTEVVRQGLGTTADPHTTTRYTLEGATTDAYARIASVKRKLGNTWIERLTSWDVSYPIEPASVTDNNGALLSTPARTVSYTYVSSSMGLVDLITEPLTASTNRTTDYTYNANNDVTQTVVGLDGGSPSTTTRHCYTTSGCATNATDLFLRSTIENYTDGTPGGPNGHVEDVTTSFQYDNGNDTFGQETRVTRQNYAQGGTLLDSRANGSVYDDLGNLTASITNYVTGEVTSPGDDVTPNTTSGARTDLTTVYSYDTAGNQVGAADPRRAVEAAKGTSLSDDDFISRSTHDALNQQLTDTTPTTPGIAITQKTSSITYDELGLIRTATDFGGLVSASEYDRAGRGTRTFEDPDGGGSTPAAVTSTTTYDPSGRVLTTADQRQVANPTTLGVTQAEYDELGRQVKSIAAYRPPPNTLADQSATSQTYDALDRQSSEEAGYPSGQVTSYTYDLGGRTIETDDEFACATATFDYRDLALTETTGLVGGTCASGADTRTVTNSYDGLARLTRSEVTAGTGTGDRTFDGAFDSAGRALTSGVRTGGVSSTSILDYNPLDQVLRETRPDGSSAKTIYDPAGNATDRCYWKPSISVGACLPEGTTPWTNPPTQITTTTYDARNQRVELRDSVTHTVTTYDAGHNYQPAAFYVPTKYDDVEPTHMEREHQTLFSYDDRHRLTAIAQQLCRLNEEDPAETDHSCSSTTTTGSDTYAYDDNDNRTTVVEDNGATSSDRRYCYDALNRLIYRNTGAACSPGTNDEAYAYDTAGNRTQSTVGTTASFTYSGEGLLTGCGTPCDVVAYDTAGNTARLKGWSYEFDAEGRLVRACEASSCATGSPDKVEFAYDGEGHRIRVVETDVEPPPVGTTTTTRDFRYQGDAIVEESTNGTVSRGYVVDEAGRILKVCDPSCASPTTTYLVTWNGHGDATALYRINGDGTLTLANSYTYTSWGEPTTATHNSIADLGFRFLYVGAHDVQWDNFSGLGLLYMHARHYSPLTARFLQPDPSAAEANLYAYAGNSPVTKTDQSGLNVAVAACFTPWTIKFCIDAGLVIVTAAGAVIVFVVHGDSRRATVTTRQWWPPANYRRDLWWRGTQIQLVKKTELEREARQRGFDKKSKGTRHGDLWVHPDGRRTIIPRHTEIPKGTAESIRRVLRSGGRRGGA